MSVWVRIRKALLASLFGWITGSFVSMPFQVVEVVRSVGVDSRLMTTELGTALALWSVLTFVMALYWCGFFLLPLAWLVSVPWMLRNRRLWITGSMAFGVALMAVRLHVWTSLDHDGVSLINFVMWAVYAGTFFSWTAAMYTKYLRASSADVPAADTISGASITL